MGVLLCLDHFCLATRSVAHAKWLVDLVDANIVRVHYRNVSGSESSCGLLSLPNWSFSYALAKFRLYVEDESSSLLSDEVKAEADSALQNAFWQFSSVLPGLLAANEVDMSGRSFRRDWATTLAATSDKTNGRLVQWSERADGIDKDELTASFRAMEFVSRLFVKQNARLWSGDDVLDFLYTNLCALQQDNKFDDCPPPPSPALLRYADIDPSQYDNRIQQLPHEAANILDPNLLAHAMNVDTTRGRLRQHEGWQQQLDDDDMDMMHQLGLMQGMHEIDPDSPLLEVFLRR